MNTHFGDVFFQLKDQGKIPSLLKSHLRSLQIYF